MNEVIKCGVRVPDELNIIGIDDYEFLNFLHPRMTVVDHVLEDLGRGGAEMLIDLIEGRINSACCRTYQPKLKTADTTGIVPAKRVYGKMEKENEQ